MNERVLRKLLEDKGFLDERISFYIEKGLILSKDSKEEIKGHLKKARHNLDFIGEISYNFNDWILVACFYTAYHAALALILSKGYSSKNHDATLCILIKEFYQNGLSKEDIELINKLDKQDFLFYVETKQKREEASYSTKTSFNLSDVKNIKAKTRLFINKTERIIKEK
jgi:uncharacterized protein (UPF0332 family)